MRLTLRTLLAYLDDVLEPNEAKELGTKINESPMALELVERIRKVIRKRSLMAPTVSGPGADVDPNLVAEYLDNTLPPEAVAEIEQICLDSDVHLAETAACHQILSLVLGEPVEISQTSRERMYALGPLATPPVSGSRKAPVSQASANVGSLGQSSGASSASPSGVRPVGPASTRTGATPAPQPKPLSETLPDYLRPQPWWKRSLVPMGLTLLVGIWLGAVYFDPTLLPTLTGHPENPQTASDGAQDNSEAEEAAESAVPNDETTNAKTDLKTPTTETELLDSGEAEVMTEKSSEAPTDPNPAVVAATPNSEEEVVVATNTPPKKSDEPTAIVKVDDAPANTKATPTEVPKLTNIPTKQQPLALYDSREGVVLRYDVERTNWYPLSYRSNLYADEAFAIPEPYEMQLNFGANKRSLSVLGPAMIGLGGDSKPDTPTINIFQGRLLLSRPAEEEGAPWVISLNIQGVTYEVQLLSAGTTCGIEVALREPQKLEEDFGSEGWSGKLWVLSGKAQLKDAQEKEYTITGLGSHVLKSSSMSISSAPGKAPNASVQPEWMVNRRLSSTQLNNAKLLEKSFTSSESAHDSLLGLVEDRRPEISRLSVSCLALLGDYEVLVQALDRNEHAESRQAAIHGIRTWVNLDPENRTLLKTALASTFYPQEVNLAYRLLWGYQEADLRDAKTSAQLMEYLNHERLSIRELSWFNIRRLAGRRYEYRPDGSPLQRRTGIQQWQKILDKEGGLLPPVEPMPTTEKPNGN